MTIVSVSSCCNYKALVNLIVVWQEMYKCRWTDALCDVVIVGIQDDRGLDGRAGFDYASNTREIWSADVG